MRALSVRQPHANRIAAGAKRVELRTWATPYRGDLLICAGKQIDREAALRLRLPTSECGPTGCAVCVVDLVACREVFEFIDDEPVNRLRVAAEESAPRRGALLPGWNRG